MKILSLAALLLVQAGVASGGEGDWPQFLGPNVDGVAVGDAPTEWSREKSVAWRTELPQEGNGSPIVVGDRVFIACTEDSKGTRRSLYCFDRKSGDQKWVKTVDFGKSMPTHKTNPHCSSTPAADAGTKRVVVWHASAGLYCYDFTGEQIWKRDLGEFRHHWGYGGSPVISGGKVFLHCGPGERVFVTAINLADGKTVWEQDEKFVGGNAERSEEGHFRGGWGTPVIATVEGKKIVVSGMPTRVVGYDPEDGKVQWFCDGLKGKRGELCYTNPVLGDGGICYVVGGYQGPSVAFIMGGAGDLTETKRVWRSEKNPQSIGTGIFYEGYFYMPGAGPAGIRCIDPKDGSVKWEDQAGKKNFWGSIVRLGDRAYVINQEGETIVFKPSPDGYEQIASNALGEGCNTTPAIAGGQIFIRTDKALYCISGSDAK